MRALFLFLLFIFAIMFGAFVAYLLDPHDKVKLPVPVKIEKIVLPPIKDYQAEPNHDKG